MSIIKSQPVDVVSANADGSLFEWVRWVPVDFGVVDEAANEVEDVEERRAKAA